MNHGSIATANTASAMAQRGHGGRWAQPISGNSTSAITTMPGKNRKNAGRLKVVAAASTPNPANAPGRCS